MQPTDSNEKVHMGRNVKRFREMFGVKQEALAFELGDDWNQKKISLMEQKETIDDVLLEQISKVLNVPVEVIKNFDEEAATVYFNTFNEGSINHGPFMGSNSTYNFNPLEKYIEEVEENKKLYEGKIELYERMLKDKNEMMEKLEAIIKNNLKS